MAKLLARVRVGPRTLMETAETFLPIFWGAFAPLVVLLLVIGTEWIGDQIRRRA
jgi:hypothetical protein